MEGYPFGSHYLRSSRVACRFSFCSFSTFSCFRLHCCCFSLMGYVGWAGGHKEEGGGRREQGSGADGGEDDVYVNDRWPRLFELFESAKKILLSTQRRPVQTNGQTDRQMKCLYCVCVCRCVCVCVWENNSASLASFIISFLNSRCCRAAASAAWHYFLFPMLSAFIKKFIIPCTVITTTTATTISRRAKALREYFRPANRSEANERLPCELFPLGSRSLSLSCSLAHSFQAHFHFSWTVFYGFPKVATIIMAFLLCGWGTVNYWLVKAICRGFYGLSIIYVCYNTLREGKNHFKFANHLRKHLRPYKV